MPAKTKPSLDEKLSPEEYDTLVALTERATRLVEDRLPDYVRATNGIGPNRWQSIERIEFKGRERTGRDPDGRYDIEVYYRDLDRDGFSLYLPSSILWDPEGAIGRTKAAIEAERVRQEELEEAHNVALAFARERDEKALAAKLAAKYGYVKR